jgi:thiosulfate/3-mercaptopyruvate sulfurtransferase
MRLFVGLFLFAVSHAWAERTLPVFVSGRWLSERLSDRDLVVLHVGFNKNEYRLGHIPGARFLWYNSLAVSTPELSTEMPSLEQADSVLENLGISERSRIILYFTGANITTTTRMLLAFSYFGFEDQVSVLDGGFEAWKKGDYPVSTDEPDIKRSSLELRLRPSMITDADWVKDHLSDPSVVIVDARTRGFYDGIGGGVKRQGHIKGAVSIPYTALLDSTTKLKDVAVLKQLFEDAELRKGKRIVTYCHVGQQATLVYAVARLLGYDSTVYDGCFEDWNFRGDEYPVVNPALKEEKKQ